MGDSEERLDMPSLPATTGGFKTPEKRKRTIDGEPRDFSADAKILDTPHTGRTANTNELENGNLEERRNAVMREVPKYVPEVPAEKFVEHFLPKISKVDEHLDSICEEVEKERVFVDNDWADLGSSMNEKEVFKDYYKLEDRVSSIAETFMGEKSRVSHHSNGNKVPESIYPESDQNRPDGATLIRDLLDYGYAYVPTILFMEFKCPNTPKKKYDVSFEYGLQSDEPHLCQNLVKLIFSMYRTLKEDWRRRFVFGFGIVDRRKARLIFICRAYIVVSDEFDIRTASISCYCLDLKI